MAGFDREWAQNQSPHSDGCRQVVMTDVVWRWFVDYVYALGLDVFPIPDADGGFDYTDDLPTYGIGPGVRGWETLPDGR